MKTPVNPDRLQSLIGQWKYKASKEIRYARSDIANELEKYACHQKAEAYLHCAKELEKELEGNGLEGNGSS